MFHTLRKVVIGLGFGLLIGVGIYLGVRWELFHSLMDLVEVVQMKEKGQPRKLEPLTGRVIQIVDDHSFRLRNNQGMVYVFQLTGLDSPAAPKATNEIIRGLREDSKSHLTQLILSNQVEILVTYLSEQRSGLSLVYLGQTNVNAAMVEGGLARLNREYLQGLPFKEKYALVRADSKARRQKAGLWKLEKDMD
jgi:endonuclease YncB( thermonuclease family)